MRSESIQIHAPPTSTIITNAPIMTMASGVLTTATMVTPSCGTRPLAGVTRVPFAMRHVANVMLSPELGTHLNEQGQWEYYSERYVRGVVGSKNRVVLPRIE